MKLAVAAISMLLIAFVLFSFATLSSSNPVLRPSRRYISRRRREAAIRNDDIDMGVVDPNASGGSRADTDSLPLMPSSGSAADDYYGTEVCDAHFKMSLNSLQEISRNCADSVPFSDCCQLKFLGVKKTGVYRIAG